MTTKVHRNLNRAAWSITRPGCPVQHADRAALVGVRFVVQPGGRARVLASKRRAVHAYAAGGEAEAGPVGPAAVEVCYNPYRAATFTTRDGRPVYYAARVTFAADGKAYAEGIV